MVKLDKIFKNDSINWNNRVSDIRVNIYYLMAKILFKASFTSTSSDLTMEYRFSAVNKMYHPVYLLMLSVGFHEAAT